MSESPTTITGQETISDEPLAPPDEASPAPWIIFLLSVALVLVLFIILALIAAPAT